MQKGERIATPAITIALLKHDESSIEGCAVEVTPKQHSTLSTAGNVLGSLIPLYVKNFQFSRGF